MAIPATAGGCTKKNLLQSPPQLYMYRWKPESFPISTSWIVISLLKHVFTCCTCGYHNSNPIWEASHLEWKKPPGYQKYPLLLFRAITQQLLKKTLGHLEILLSRCFLKGTELTSKLRHFKRINRVCSGDTRQSSTWELKTMQGAICITAEENHSLNHPY